MQEKSIGFVTNVEFRVSTDLYALIVPRRSLTVFRESLYGNLYVSNANFQGALTEELLHEIY